MIRDINPAEFGLKPNEFKESIDKAKAAIIGFPVSQNNLYKLYAFVLNCIENLYLKLKVELSSSDEKERFDRIESNLNNILFEVHKKGIRINSTNLKKHIEQINIELYDVKNKLQLEYGIFSLHDYKNIQKRLCEEFSWFKDINVNSKEFWKAIKFQRSNSNLVNLLYLEKKLTKNKTILTRLGSLDSEFIHPDFDYFGTVTGRILVFSPSIQQLNKKYRDIIVPNSDMELIYIDYSQFEAGILAFEAKEFKLIEMYNSNDIYTEISNKLGNENVPRDLSKKLFFAYCYGMSKEKIKKYSGKNLDLFFNEFPNLEIFENKIKEEFLKDGFIETRLGNRRFKSIDNIDNQNEGWLISQKIQGLASLILKEVILEINKKNREIEFLLPMHDAVLYQVPKDRIKELKPLIVDTFKEILKRYCPELNPKVTDTPFFEII
jgi:DNA polymerase I-like protein with 3'-5' exonuclease and polymerase domains